MDTPTTSTYAPSIADTDQNYYSEVFISNVNAIPELTLNDAPWPGHIFIISYQDTNQVLTYHKEKGVVLQEYDGSHSQRWICHSKSGWLGFTANPGDTTTYLAHYDWKLRCRDTMINWNGMFCVRKRLKRLDGFQILMRGNDDSLWPVGMHEDSDVAVLQGSDAWWGFTMIA
ncbi:hypothetical protein TWF970_002970 [Orbilia oligospora]|uniref:Uncharacterized protein n=1 Tax=Orbilia oligospora TaxID=2813651 RepID=A0A7C8R935_ORBOL|nr:hypothetical protein TWF970_002970 [Orbilia oligospora]